MSQRPVLLWFSHQALGICGSGCRCGVRLSPSAFQTYKCQSASCSTATGSSLSHGVCIMNARRTPSASTCTLLIETLSHSWRQDRHPCAGTLLACTPTSRAAWLHCPSLTRAPTSKFPPMWSKVIQTLGLWNPKVSVAVAAAMPQSFERRFHGVKAIWRPHAACAAGLHVKCSMVRHHLHKAGMLMLTGHCRGCTLAEGGLPGHDRHYGGQERFQL